MQTKIVIGANFGDEGKGQTTKYLAEKMLNENKKVIVVKHNGGAQAGHTADGFIFHQYGSASKIGVETFLFRTFMFNPIMFLKEYKDLKDVCDVPKMYVSSEVEITTPIEMLLNQIKEVARGKNRHGSCGLGIYETFKRKSCGVSFAIKDLKDEELMNNKLKKVINRFKKEINNLTLEIDPQFINVVKNIDIVMENFKNDIRESLKLIHIVHNDIDFLKQYNIIFETGQGLMLDEKNLEYYPNLTPSDTTSLIPILATCNMNRNDDEIEVVYVTRTYFTRHGAGTFTSECDKKCINETIIDTTNVANDYQEVLRYGYFDFQQFNSQIEKDQALYTKHGIVPIKSLAVTFGNKTNYEFMCKDDNYDIVDNTTNFNNVYIFHNKETDNVRHIRND